MAGVQASAGGSVMTQAQLNAGMVGVNGSGNGSSPATWTYAWFAIAVVFILCVYFGFGGMRGAVAS